MSERTENTQTNAGSVDAGTHEASGVNAAGTTSAVTGTQGGGGGSPELSGTINLA
jgi:hypothetical protein